MVPSLKKKANYSVFLEKKILKINAYFYGDSGGRVTGLSHLDFQMQFLSIPSEGIGWQRNCINLVPVKMLKTKGFVSSMISYNYPSLALDNSQSILMPGDHMGKGVSRRFCVHLTDHSLCGAPAFVQISTVGEGMGTVFKNLRKYWLMFCTKAVTFTSWWWCDLQLDGPWSGGHSWPYSMANSKILCYSLEREV